MRENCTPKTVKIDFFLTELFPPPKKNTDVSFLGKICRWTSDSQTCHTARPEHTV